MEDVEGREEDREPEVQNYKKYCVIATSLARRGIDSDETRMRPRTDQIDQTDPASLTKRTKSNEKNEIDDFPMLLHLLPRILMIRSWIERTLDAHAKEARSAAAVIETCGFRRLPAYFDAALLGRIRCVAVERVPVPPLASMGLRLFAGFESKQFRVETLRRHHLRRHLLCRSSIRPERIPALPRVDPRGAVGLPRV